MSGRGRRADGRLKVDLAAWWIGAVLVLIGAGILYLSELVAGRTADAGDVALREFGALLFVTGAVGVVWDLRGRRALTEELLDAAGVSSDLAASGIKRILPSYLKVDWDQMLESATHVDLFFTYARTWRSAHATALRQLVGREDSRVRIILPDRENALLMEALRAKFGYELDDLVSHIKSAEDDFRNLNQQGSGTVEVRRTAEFPVYSLYRLDGTLVMVFYAQAQKRVDVPAVVCERGGSLYGFFKDQFEALWSEATPMT